MHTGAGACIFKHKKARKEWLTAINKNALRSDGQIS